MVSVSELVVAIRGDGIDETEQDLESMNETVQESSEELSEQAGMMEQLGGEFAGALGVAVTGLAVASAGLLSQVPVLGQLFQGLFAVVQALALTMDTVLRPVLGPISKKLFDLSAAIAGTEGEGRKLVGVLTTVATVLAGALAAAIKFAGAAAVFGKIAGAATTAASVIVGAITTIAGILSLPVSATAALVAGVIALLLTLIFNFRGWRTKMVKILKTAAIAIKKGIGKIVSGLIAKASTIATVAKELASTIKEKIGEIDWFAVGKTIIQMIAQGMEAASSFLDEVAAAIANEVRKYLPFSPAETGPLSDLDKTGPALVDEFASGISSNKGQVGKAASSMAGEAKQSGGSQLPSPRETTPKIILDGREVGRGTGGERFDESARRGQTF